MGGLSQLYNFNAQYEPCTNLPAFSFADTPGLTTYIQNGWSIYIGYNTQPLINCNGNLTAEVVGYNICTSGILRKSMANPAWVSATDFTVVDNTTFQVPSFTNRNITFSVHVFSPCGPCAANNYPNFINNSSSRWKFDGRRFYAQNIQAYSSSIPIPMKIYLAWPNLPSSVTNSWSPFVCGANGNCYLF
jgi:hypothetical protein